jgi:hypothetical protein
MSPDERTRKNRAVILQALAATSQVVVAKRMGTSESAVCHMKDAGGLIDKVVELLTALDLKPVGEGDRTYDPEVIRAMHTMARLGFQLSPDVAAMRSPE